MRSVKAACLILAAFVLSSCGPENPRAAKIEAMAGSTANGRTLFARDCASCHQAKGMTYATEWYPRRAFLSVILDGVPETRMRSFASYSDQDVADIYAYLQEGEK